MKKNTLRRSVLGQLALWIFRAYCLFFAIEIFRFFKGVKEIHPPVGHEIAGYIGITAGGMIVFVPLLLIMGLLFWFSWLTRGKPEQKIEANNA